MKLFRQLDLLGRSIGIAARNPRRVIGRILELEDDRVKQHVIERHGLDRGLPTVDWMDLLESKRETVDPYSFLEGGSMVTDLALLKGMARRFDECRYFEIGAWRGESVANVAAVAKQCVSLSLSDQEILDLGFTSDYVKMARIYSKHLANVEHIGHNSMTFDFGPYEKSMDLVFVDGDHGYDGVLKDTQSAFKLLRNDESIIVWHDYIRTPERNVWWEVFGGILDGCPAEKRKHLYHVSNTLCAVYINADLPTFQLNYPMIPNKAFSAELEVRPI